MKVKSLIFTVLVSLLLVQCAAGAERYYIAHSGEYMSLKPLKGGGGIGFRDAPSGTRPAYERVRDRKVNAVKLDVRYTADKIIVLSHDPDLKKTTGQNLSIIRHTYAELKKVTFLKAGKYDKEHLFTLGEALDIVKECDLFYLDFKYSTPEMIRDVFSQFQTRNIPLEKIIIATFNRQALKDAAEIQPDVRRVLHVKYEEQNDGSFTCSGEHDKMADFAAVKTCLLKLVKEYDLYGLNLPTRCEYTTPELAAELKAADVQWLSLWHVHSTAIAEKFHDSVVDGFVTGCPSAIRAYLENKQGSPVVQLPSRGICAHQGAVHTHPSNTLAALREAVRLGAHMIEFDIILTKDNHIVLMHDNTVNRTTNGKGKVAELTFDEVRALDAGSWKNPAFAGEKVPTLREALEIMPSNIWLNVHAKSNNPQLAVMAAREISRQGRLHQAFIAVDHVGADAARAVVPAILVCNMQRQKDSSLYIAETIERQYNFIQLRGEHFKQLVCGSAETDDMAKLKRAGVKINCYMGGGSPKTEEELQMLLEAGIDFPLVNFLEPMLQSAQKFGIFPMQHN